MMQAKLSDTTRECADCRTISPSDEKACHACGGSTFRSRHQSRFPYDAIAAFIGVVVVLLYWLARA
jgi:uncharacterized paraquat-inducible protein A